MRYVIAVAMIGLAACGGGDGGVSGPVEIGGRYTLTAVNGKPLPYVAPGASIGVFSGHVTLKIGLEYDAHTCYALQSDGRCQASRAELGTYTLNGNTVALDAAGYKRNLTASHGTLTQNSGGDTGSLVLTYTQ